MTIKEWPQNERPREKLLNRGPAALSDAELLAIFLRTGCMGLSAVDLARSLLTSFGDLRSLLSANQENFCAHKGLGPAKYCQLQACLEMTRRHQAISLSRENHLNSSDAVQQYLLSQLRDRHSEVFAVLFLDSQNRLIQYEELFQGTIDGASVYPREVVKSALRHNAAAVIFSHNHPSGVAEPSDADKHITQNLKQALDLVDIRTLDHIVVGDGYTVSFAERGWL
ncbi:MAG: DNA repair protein RadC [Arenicella sp.]|jgi:DNA repair protein RadC